MAKYTGQISTGQYEFLAFELEGTAEEATEAYKGLQEAWNPKQDGIGVPLKEFNAFLDSFLNTSHAPDGGLEVWERMSTQQKIIVNEVKKSIKRITSKNHVIRAD